MHITDITEEMLTTLYTRVQEVYLSKHGHLPDEIHLEAGLFYCVYSEYYCGDTEYTNDYIHLSELTTDLDELVQLRLEREAKAKEDSLRLQKEAQAKEVIRQTELRRKKYLELKKEFEN